MMMHTKPFFMRATDWQERSSERLVCKAEGGRCGNRSGEHPIQGIPAEDRRGKRPLLPRGTVRFVLILIRFQALGTNCDDHQSACLASDGAGQWRGDLPLANRLQCVVRAKRL